MVIRTRMVLCCLLVLPLFAEETRLPQRVTIQTHFTSNDVGIVYARSTGGGEDQRFLSYPLSMPDMAQVIHALETEGFLRDLEPCLGDRPRVQAPEPLKPVVSLRLRKASGLYQEQVVLDAPTAFRLSEAGSRFPSALRKNFEALFGPHLAVKEGATPSTAQ